MARSRNIKPSFFSNDELGELDPLARLAFIGMWTIADFKGCIEYRPKMLKVQLLPYDDCDIELITNNLDKARFIRFYSVQGKRYIKIVNFEKHQNPHKNEKEAGSNIPDITNQDIIDNENNELTKDGTKPDLIGTDRADSLLLIPSTLIPDCIVTPKRKTKTKLPEVIEPTDSHIEFAKQNNLSIIDEMIRFRLHHEEKMTMSGSWNASFSKWLHNAVQFRRPSFTAKQDSLKRTGDLLTGRSRENEPFTIDVD